MTFLAWSTIPFDRVLAYTYEADYHCRQCARQRFGDSLDVDAIDREGNAVWPVFPGQLDPQDVIGCSDCGRVICLHCGDTRSIESRSVGATCPNCDSEWTIDDND